MNKTLAVTTTAAAFLLLFTTTAQAQAQTPDTAMSDDNTSLEDKQLVIGTATSYLWNLTNSSGSAGPSITISEDGEMSISSVYNKPNGEQGSMIILGMPHPWTESNGYKIDNGQLIAPNGTAIFP